MPETVVFDVNFANYADCGYRFVVNGYAVELHNSLFQQFQHVAVFAGVN